MKSISIQDGDIQLSVSRRMDFVSGEAKLRQDLELWLRESLGIGPTSPGFGSRLSSYLGMADVNTSRVLIDAEVRRVLSLYQAWQLDRLRKAKNSGQLQSWSRSEVLDEVVSVKTTVEEDRVVVAITLKTLREGLLDVMLTLPTGVM